MENKKTIYAFEKHINNNEYPSLKLLLMQNEDEESALMNKILEDNTCGWSYNLHGNKDELIDLCKDVEKFIAEKNYILLRTVLAMLKDCVQLRCAVTRCRMTQAEKSDFYNGQQMIPVHYNQDQKHEDS
jgi:hypothetical protein